MANIEIYELSYELDELTAEETQSLLGGSFTINQNAQGAGGDQDNVDNDQEGDELEDEN